MMAPLASRVFSLDRFNSGTDFNGLRDRLAPASVFLIR